jgi:S1-C subfamily serine protease
MRKKRTILSLLLSVIAAVLTADGAANAPYDRRTPIVEAVEKILPAVVNISTTKVVSVNRSPFPRNLRTPFDELFNEMFQEQYRLQGLGSGVLIEGGYVVTNNHVVAYEEYQLGPADQIFINLYDEKEPREAVLIGANPADDVAILKLKGEAPVHYLPWGRSDDLLIGETVIAAGSALGQPFTVTTGIISALNRTMEISNRRRYNNLIQTNADINQGNSGGPLVNINGEFIGLNTMILSPSGGSVGLGFAIPVSRIKKIYDYWINHIISLEDQLGLVILDVDPKIVRLFKEKYDKLRDVNLDGVYIDSVSMSGLSIDYLKPWDIILEVDGKVIEDSADFLNRLEEHRSGELNLKIIREDNTLAVHMQVASQKVETDSWMAMTFQSLDNCWRGWFDIPEKFAGVVVLSVDPGSEAEKAGIQRGDVLVNVNNKLDLFSLADLRKAKTEFKNDKVLLLQIYRLVEKRWQPHRVELNNKGAI